MVLEDVTDGFVEKDISRGLGHGSTCCFFQLSTDVSKSDFVAVVQFLCCLHTGICEK